MKLKIGGGSTKKKEGRSSPKGQQVGRGRVSFRPCAKQEGIEGRGREETVTEIHETMGEHSPGSHSYAPKSEEGREVLHHGTDAPIWLWDHSSSERGARKKGGIKRENESRIC